MTSTIVNSTLSVTITEAITLGGTNYGSVNIHTIADIDEIDKRILTVTTSEVTVAEFGAASEKSKYITGDVQYMRFTNLDDTNHIVLNFQNIGNDEVAIKLDAGKTFLVFGDNVGGMGDVMDADNAAISSVALDSMKSVTADADTASCDLEMIIASK